MVSTLINVFKDKRIDFPIAFLLFPTIFRNYYIYTSFKYYHLNLYAFFII
jgi:hypothetical protein